MDAGLPQGMNTMYQSGQHRSSYHDFSGHSQYGSQQGAHTLPPIQPQRSAYSQPQQPYGGMGREQQHPGQGMGYPNYPSQSVSQSPYAQSITQYSQPYSQAPTHMSMAHDYQHPQSQNLPNIRPMPPGSAAGGAHGYHMQHLQDQDYHSRTHVVGSQGRRGILPSDEGRPAAPLATGNGSSAKNATIPPKDAEGKYPCPHCTKTYLHAKHLKRHLLRHTGDRPYSCALCSDTFSRSDILKRHFQKCSIRRGNPTGATHLSNSQSHLKKQQQAKKAASTATTDTGFPTAPHTPTSVTFGDSGQGLGMSHVPTGNNAQGLSSRSDHDRPFDEGRRSLTGSTLYHRGATGVPTQNGQSSLPSSGSSTPITGRMPQAFTPDSQPSTRGNSFSQQGYQQSNQNRQSLAHLQNPSNLENSFDWSSLKHRDNPQLPSPTHQETPLRHDADQKLSYSSVDQAQGEYMNLFPREGGSYNDGLNWSMPNTYQQKADQLTLFCQLEGSIDPDDRLLSFCIDAENIEHFLQCYMHYDAHWPTLHLPTFDPLDVYDGLILAMICVGAIYSDKLGHQQVRSMLRKTQNLLSKNTEVSAWIGLPVANFVFKRRFESSLFYELAALQLVGIVSLWHGEQDMRDLALQNVPNYLRFAQQMCWLEPLPRDSANFSPLHQPDPLAEMEAWKWTSWIAQEARVRWAYIWWMADSALNLFCNTPPTVDPTDVQLPLPADDAVWTATSSQECASALGLNGAAAQHRNVTGSRRRKQPEMHLAVKALMHPDQQLVPGATNIYSKFILIHALIVQIVKANKGFLSNASYKPDTGVSHCDWIISSPDGSLPAYEESTLGLLAATERALGKFKALWDTDLVSQYPNHTPRIGFCRDGIHYYWLARMLLRNKSTSDWYAPWRLRFRQILQSLKQVRKWVASDAASRGADIGSVAAIDEKYGMQDLTIDMKLLFAPLAQGMDTSTTPA